MRKTRISREDISDAQRTAARLLLLHPDWSKDQIAEVAGISRTALYGWLRDSRFQGLLEENAVNPRPPLITTQDIIGRLDESGKADLLAQLQKHEHAPMRPDISKQIEDQVDRLKRRLESASLGRRKTIKTEIEKLIGRLQLMHDPYAPIHFDSDGNPKPPTVESAFLLAEDFEELAILEKVLRGTDSEESMIRLRFAFAIAAAIRAGIDFSEPYSDPAVIDR